MNTALIIAGGVGSRAGQEIPKQFLTVNEIPIIIYTLKTFQEHPGIDSIVAVTLPAWREVLRVYCRQFGISKLEAVVDAGETRFGSIHNGVRALADRLADGDIVTLHDANRPLVDAALISEGQRVAARYGSALAVLSCSDAMFISHDRKVAADHTDKKVLFQGQTPETFRYAILREACAWAERENAGDLSVSAILLKQGVEVRLIPSSSRNFKITTPEDIDMFKALLSVPRTQKVRK